MIGALEADDVPAASECPAYHQQQQRSLGCCDLLIRSGLVPLDRIYTGYNMYKGTTAARQAVVIMVLPVMVLPVTGHTWRGAWQGRSLHCPS
jgi:hypothetical protein